MTRAMNGWGAAVAVALLCTGGVGEAWAANLMAVESGEVAFFVPDDNWNVTEFEQGSAPIDEQSDRGSGAFFANATATGSALIVLTEGPGGANSDWLELIYSGAGGIGTETVQALWRSDNEPIDTLPALPPGVVPQFLAETGEVQDVTALLAASATASGFAFPSNITVQVQSDPPELPEPASLALLSAAVAAFGGLGIVRRRRRA